MLRENDVKMIVLLLATGVSEAMKEGKLSVKEAERVLFTPATMKLVGFDQALESLIHKGTELENIERLLPDRLESAIKKIRAQALMELDAISDKSSMEEHTWLRRLLDQE